MIDRNKGQFDDDKDLIQDDDIKSDEGTLGGEAADVDELDEDEDIRGS